MSRPSSRNARRYSPEYAGNNVSEPPTVVVGGGLAGLTAAAELARAGREVTLFESAKDLGGRASTRDLDGYRFNLGPRALYAAGPGRAVLDDLGVRFTGRTPSLDRPLAWVGGRLAPLPVDFWSLLSCRLRV